ncbi:MAG: pyruvate,orthophosphate dikinase, partial [Ilumatobacter sp.]
MSSTQTNGAVQDGGVLQHAVSMAVAAGDTPESRADAVRSITAADLDAVIHAQFDAVGSVLTSGIGASPGAAVGKVYFSSDDAADAADRGEAVILVCNETTPADVHGMMVSAGLLTTKGGLVSHAAVVARGWGTPAVVGAEAIKIANGLFSVGDVTVAKGDVISIDGASGDVVVGERSTAVAAPPEEFFTILSWADAIGFGHMAVRANADNGPDAAKAREMGAEGIGLCRTEHMFLAADRLPVVRRMILARDADEESEALEELGRVQQVDFEEILRVMDGMPVTVRLLDPPLHEFLPSVAQLTLKEATEGLTDFEQRELRAAESWAEHNPMIGTRGVRLGVLKPGLYAM